MAHAKLLSDILQENFNVWWLFLLKILHFYLPFLDRADVGKKAK